MARFLFNQVEFISSAAKSDALPTIKADSGTPLPEIAIVGRSNVGKSSLLNYIFKKKNFARVSQTPGKTQLINFFKIDEEIVFVDLPGYGFAKVPKEMRLEWGPLIQGYLDDRKQLRLVLFLFDIRRDPTDEDRSLMEWFFHYQKPFILVLTKKDKLNRSEVEKRKREITALFPEYSYEKVLISSTKEEGKEDLIRVMKNCFNQNK